MGREGLVSGGRKTEVHFRLSDLHGLAHKGCCGWHFWRGRQITSRSSHTVDAGLARPLPHCLHRKLFHLCGVACRVAISRNYGIGTVKKNRIGLPAVDKKALSREPQGTLWWRMHTSKHMSCMAFVDRKAVLLLSSVYAPIPAPTASWPTVPRRVNGIVTDLETSPVHKAYTEFMRGVDVADQLRGSYTCQTRSHKWWHKIFFYLQDTSLVNAFILYKVAAEELGKIPQLHLHFQLGIADELSQLWALHKGSVSQFHLSAPGVHGLVCSER